MDACTWAAFQDEVQKLAELTPEEHAAFKDVRRQQAEFDRLSSEGALDDAGQAAHRANTERLKAYTAKSRGSSSSIPHWAADPKGVPPTAGRPPPRPSPGSYPGRDVGSEEWWDDIYRRAATKARNPPVYLPHFGIASALAGGGLGALAGANQVSSVRGRRELQRGAETGGVVSKLTNEHPILVPAVVGALAGAGFGFSNPLAALSAITLPSLGLSVLDRATRDGKKAA